MHAHQQLDRGTESNDSQEEDTIRIPDALDSPRTKLVYLHLATGGGGTVEEVRNALGIELISLYPVLNTLTSEGLVRKDGSRYACLDTNA
jgi:predicted transcriptional regulator